MAIDIGPKIGIDGEAEFRKQISQINQQIKTFSAELKAASSAADSEGNALQKNISVHQQLMNLYTSQKKKYDEINKAIETATQKYGENSTQVLRLKETAAKVETQMNKLEGQLSDNNEEFSKLSDESKRAGDSVAESGNKAADSSSKWEKLGNGLKTAAAAIGAAVTAAAAAVGVTIGKVNDCIEVYATFEDSMAQVAATMGMTADEIASGSEEYELLTKTAKEMGASTRYSASEAADALNYLALAGYDANKACEALPGILTLAAAGGMDLAATSDLVTDAMSALGMETSELNVFMDQMAKTSQKSNTSVSQLGEGLLVAAGTIASTGQSLDIANTALGVLADNGIKGAEGGTHLRNVLLSLASPTDEALFLLKELGVSVYDSEGNMRNFTDVLGEMKVGLDKLTDEDRNYTLTNIFNKTDLNAVNALLSSTTGRFEELNTMILDSEGAAQKMSDTMESGLAGSARSFGSAMEGLQIEVGGIFAGMKQDIMDSTTSIISTLTGALSQAGGDFGKIGEAVGQALQSIINLINQSLPQLVDIGLQIVGSIGNGILNNLSTIIDAAVEVVTSLINGLIDAMPALADGALQLVMGLVDGLLQNLGNLMEAAAQMIAALAEGLGNALPELIPTMVQAVITMVTTLVDNIPLLVDAALKLIVGLAEGLIAAIPTLIAAIPQIINSVISAIVEAAPQLIPAALELIAALAMGLLQAIPTLVSAIPQLIAAIVGAFTNHDWGAIGSNIINGIKNGITKGVSAIAEAARNAANKALNAAKNFLGIHSPSTVFRDQIGKNMMLGMANGLNQYSGLASDAAKTAAGDVMGAFNNNVYVPKYSNGTAAAYNNLAASMGNLTVVLNDGTLVGKISPKIDATLGGYTKMKGRYGV